MNATMPLHRMTDEELIREAELSENNLAQELAKRLEERLGVSEEMEQREEKITELGEEVESLKEELADAKSALADCEAELD